MHDVLPLYLAFVAQVGLQFLELAHHISVIRLVDHPGEEEASHFQQFQREPCRMFDHRRIEAFQHVRVGLEG